MAKDKEPTESLTGMAKQTADQITGQTQEATENYFRWFQYVCVSLEQHGAK
jgi:hypothetical protein